MRVAIVHEWLVFKAGSESVVEQILEIFPGADVYSAVNFLDDEGKKSFKTKKFHTSFIQKLPFAKKKYRAYLPLMPFAVEQYDLSDYDLIISSSHAVAKGVLTGPDQIHISYVHSPIRYAWDLQHSYLKEAGLTKGLKSLIARVILHYIRLWDYRTSNGVDYFVANSKFIGRRIRKVYGRESTVIYPPVHLDAFSLCKEKEDFYLTVSRFVPYKKIPMIVEAFASMPDKKLVVIGDGPEDKAVRAAAGPNVTFLSHQDRRVLVDYMQRAKAFVFAAEEDFGIVPVEAQGCGTPVIAFGKGGAVETVVDGVTGVLFKEQTVSSLIDAVKRFEGLAPSFDPDVIRKNAERFDVPVFKKNFKDFVDQVLAAHQED
ncbi:MAG: glycosyltransferase family 4 protein [Proteobacteria bacterium]|nr:glycosyltransferase family 4 protein [Pseudomonadota bacterium]